MNDPTLHFSRRKFIRLCGGTIAALTLGQWPSAEAAQQRAAEAPLRQKQHVAHNLRGGLDIQYVRQLITRDPAVSRTIMWQADELLGSVRVEYRLPNAARSLQTEASYDFFTGADRSFYIYSSTLTNLTPDTAYEYRILCGSYGTDWFPLRSAGRSTCRGLLFPDSQCIDYNCWRKIALLAATRNPDAELFINMGDLVDNGQAQDQWRAWFDGVNGICEHLPLVPLMGNHEAYSLDWEYCLPRDYLHEFTLPNNGSSRFAEYYFSFDFGPVHFTVLNTQFEELDGLRPGLLDEEIPWLRQDVRSSSKPWKVILMHRDIFTYSDQPDGPDIGNIFMPIFDELKIDLVLSAHLHTYRNRGHIYNHQPADHGPVYIVTGVAGDIRYPDIWINPTFDKVVAPQPETDNYITFEASPRQFDLRCFLPNGDEIDHLQLQKQVKK